MIVNLKPEVIIINIKHCSYTVKPIKSDHRGTAPRSKRNRNSYNQRSKKKQFKNNKTISSNKHTHETTTAVKYVLSKPK